VIAGCFILKSSPVTFRKIDRDVKQKSDRALYPVRLTVPT